MNLIHEHMIKHSGCAAEDVYKLLYHAVLGPEHLLKNDEAAYEYLRKEWTSQQPDASEQLITSVSPNDQIFRVHIRPLKARMTSFEGLWRAFHASAANPIEKKETFIKVWRKICNIAPSGLIGIPSESLRKLDKHMAGMDYPCGRHSESFRAANKPAYRVVLKPFLVLINVP